MNRLMALPVLSAETDDCSFAGTRLTSCYLRQGRAPSPKEIDMNSLILDGRAMTPPLSFASSRRDASVKSTRTFRRIEDRQFAMMEATFGRTGGLARDNVVAHQLRRHTGQPVSALAHWIVERTIVCLPWHSHMLVPMFQFNPDDMTLRPGAHEVLRELVDVFDDWELALWFARPNAWLHGATPVDKMVHDQLAVHRAARADRFIARG